MILALDTSTDIAGVALCDTEDVLAEITWFSRSRHSSTLPSALDAAFALANRNPADVTALVVATGPGSFNGLRVGLSMGKGMALALQIPFVGVSTLDGIGFSASQHVGHVWVVIGAGRGEICIAEYESDGTDWRRNSDYLRTSLSEAVGRLPQGARLSGPAAEQLAEAANVSGKTFSVVPPAWNVPRASFLAELGRRYLENGGKSQLDDVEPLYLRLSAAEEKRAAATQE